MSSSKIIEPSESIINTYILFCNVNLALTLLLTPLLLYVIFTQSKELKSFKWFLLHHTFWCLVYGMYLEITKPLLLTPGCSMYALGFTKASNMAEASIAALLETLIGANAVVSLGATIGYRYIMVFPTKLSKFLTAKIILAGAVIGMGLSSSIIIGYGYITIQIDSQIIYRMANEYDSDYAKFFKEKSFVFIPLDYCIPGAKVLFFVLCIILVSSITIIVYFITLVKQFKATASLQRSLILSSVAQLLITTIFLTIPVSAFLGFMTFQIERASIISVYLCCLLSLHCLFEFLATLYFVKPYRKFCQSLLIKIFQKVWFFKKVCQSKNFKVDSSDLSWKPNL